jgi:AcrR family transcriptional regulator
VPRLIDHDARDQEIAAAALRVLGRDGLTSLSVRKVAEEAGLATASLRRAFPTQDALRRFCLQAVAERATRRIRGLAGEGIARVEAMLAELLPLDEERRVELGAQVQLGALALTDDALHAEVVTLNLAVRGACTAGITELDRTGGQHASRDAEAEAETLHALLDGTALHLLWHPESLPGDAARVLLGRHLRALAGPVSGGRGA